MKKVILSFLIITPTLAPAGGGGGLRPEGSIFKMVGNDQGTMGGSVGTMKLAGNGFGTTGGSQVGTLMVRGFLGGTGGGGVLVKGSHDNSSVGNF